MKVFVDTNVLIDFVCQRGDFAKPATCLITLGYIGKVQLQTLALSYVTAMFVANKYKYEKVDESLLFVSGFTEILDLQASTVVEMLTSGWKDYEDATQNATAIRANADCIVTRNKKDFADSTLPIYTVEELFEVLGLDDVDEDSSKKW